VKQPWPGGEGQAPEAYQEEKGRQESTQEEKGKLGANHISPLSSSSSTPRPQLQNSSQQVDTFASHISLPTHENHAWLGVVEYPLDLQSGALPSSSLGVWFKPNRNNQGNSLSLCFTGKLSLARVWACTWSGCAGHISNRICTSVTQQDPFHYQITKLRINKQANHLTSLWVASDQHHMPVKQGKFHQ
jgi:hypothetical protein